MEFKKLYLYICSAVVTICAGGCAKEDIPLFQSDDSGIYFQRVTMWTESGERTYSDSITYSFAAEEASVKSKKDYLLVSTMGKLKNYDRPIKISINEAKTTAIKGYHYELDVEDAVIKAGTSTDTLIIKFLRTEDLMEQSVNLVLRLEENEYFKCYLPEYKNTNVPNKTGAQISGVEFKFIVNESYTKPFYWEIFGDNYFGPWSAKKFVTLNNYAGWTVKNWRQAGVPGTPIRLGRFNFVATRFRNYLQKLADAKTPVREADGSLMQLGPAYLVDYSDYDE